MVIQEREMNDKRVFSERLSMINILDKIKLDLKITWSVLFAVFAAAYIVYQSWDKMFIAQASQAQEIMYQGRSIETIIDSLQKQNQQIDLLKDTINANRIEYMTLVAAIRAENKERYSSIISNEEIIIAELKRTKPH